jgi:hypothetical protein
VLTDVADIRKALAEQGVDIEKIDSQGSSLQTYLNNIEIACDLNDDESDNWKIGE